MKGRHNRRQNGRENKIPKGRQAGRKKRKHTIRTFLADLAVHCTACD